LLLYYRAHRDLHSFPTRRSSDLGGSPTKVMPCFVAPGTFTLTTVRPQCPRTSRRTSTMLWVGAFQKHRPSRRIPPRIRPTCTSRSEEHTSELQSPCNLVCRLLLE